MKVKDIQELLGLESVAGEAGLDREVTGGYAGDLLSVVMANCSKGDLWLTVQGHQNIVAVAVLRELAGIVLVNGRKPDEDTLVKAADEGIPVLLSPWTSYELAGRLYEAGIGKKAG